MDPEDESQENKPISYGNTGTMTKVVNEYDTAPSCSFTSAKFDPIKALNTPNLCEDDIDTYEDLYALRNKAHSEALLVTSHEGVEGVDGPGGFPSEVIKPKITAERHFTEDQGPLPGKARKRLRNVLNRMEEVQGPFAALRKCRDTQTRVKVYTRSYNEVRGIMTGYVVAFDKHWNLVLRDVDEIFHKKIKCKTPVFDDVENFTKVADLSLREENDPEYRDPSTDKTSLIWQNPFSKKTNRGCKSQQSVPTSDKKPCSEVSSRLDSKYNDWEARRETRTTHGCRVDRTVLRGSSSFTREANALRLGRPTIWDDVRESSNEKRELCGDGKSKPKKVSEKVKSDLEEDSDKSEQLLKPPLKSPVSPKIVKHRKRKRSKIELRQRHVGQILVRGENVVLVNVLEV